MKRSKPFGTSPTTWMPPTKKPRKQLKQQARELAAFLRRAGYPFDWSPAVLGRCHAHRLYAGNRLVGAVWFQPLPCGRASLHLHVAPDLRGRWVTPRTLRYLARAARATRVQAVLASPLSQHEPLVVRLGFAPIGDGWFQLDLYHGQVCLPSGPAAASAP